VQREFTTRGLVVAAAFLSFLLLFSFFVEAFQGAVRGWLSGNLAFVDTSRLTTTEVCRTSG
jgi:hypothetical protein